MNRFQVLVINEALEDPEPLTAWEYDFIRSIADVDPEVELSDKQNAVINRISQKYQ